MINPYLNNFNLHLTFLAKHHSPRSLLPPTPAVASTPGAASLQNLQSGPVARSFSPTRLELFPALEYGSCNQNIHFRAVSNII